MAVITPDLNSGLEVQPGVALRKPNLSPKREYVTEVLACTGRCCNYARSFFGGNCACDASTQNQARLFYGYSTDQLNAGESASH